MKQLTEALLNRNPKLVGIVIGIVAGLLVTGVWAGLWLWLR